MNIGIQVFDEVGSLDMAGPCAVFTTAARLQARGQPPGGPPPFPVVTIARGAARILAAAGSSAGIDTSLHRVERLQGRELALRTARQMDFDGSPAP